MEPQAQLGMSLGTLLSINSLGKFTAPFRAGNVPGVVEWNFLEGKPSDLGRKSIFWLVVWNVNFIFHVIYGMSSFPLTKSYFSEGWFNHQPDFDPLE
jgi:hypothetical protein